MPPRKRADAATPAGGNSSAAAPRAARGRGRGRGRGGGAADDAAQGAPQAAAEATPDAAGIGNHPEISAGARGGRGGWAARRGATRGRVAQQGAPAPMPAIAASPPARQTTRGRRGRGQNLASRRGAAPEGASPSDRATMPDGRVLDEEMGEAFDGLNGGDSDQMMDDEQGGFAGGRSRRKREPSDDVPLQTPPGRRHAPGLPVPAHLGQPPTRGAIGPPPGLPIPPHLQPQGAASPPQGLAQPAGPPPAAPAAQPPPAAPAAQPPPAAQQPAVPVKPCPSCGRTDHQRSNSLLCPNHKPSARAAGKKETLEKAKAGGVENVKTVMSTIKTSMESLCADLSLIPVFRSLADEFTKCGAAACWLLENAVTLWLDWDKRLPALDQTLLFRILMLVVTGELRVIRSPSLAAQLPFLVHSIRIWLGNQRAEASIVKNPAVKELLIATDEEHADAYEDGLRFSYPVFYAAPVNEAEDGENLPYRMVPSFFSGECAQIFNSSYKQYENNIDLYLKGACNRNFKTAFEQDFALLQWQTVTELPRLPAPAQQPEAQQGQEDPGNAQGQAAQGQPAQAEGGAPAAGADLDLDDDEVGEDGHGQPVALPKTRLTALRDSCYTAAHSRRKELRIYSFGGNEGAGDGGNRFITEARMNAAIQANQPIEYQYKTPGMRRGRRFLLPVPLIREILQLVALYRSLYVAKEGEYKLWFEEMLTDILPTVQKQFRNDRKGEVEKLMRHITGTYNQAHQIENSVQIGIAGSPQLLTVARLRNLVNANGACMWEFRSMGGITQMALDPARTARLLAFILDAIRRHMQIVHNGMDGAPDDWNRLLRFIRRTNDMIAASFVPRPPPDPRPANWNDPEPPTSPILPLYSTTPKHIDIAGDQCIGELLKRWKRLFPQRYRDFEVTFFHGNFVNQRTSPHLREAWPRLFKINDLISDGDKSKYKNVPRSFAFSIASDSVAVSVKFEKIVPKVVYDASQVRAADGMGDEDEDVARRARAAEANRKMTVDALKEAEVLYQRRDAGEIEVREIGADPGVSAILTCASETGGVHSDGTPEYSFFSISPKRWMSEIGVTQRNANRNWQASQDLPTQQPPGDLTSLYDPAGRSMADIYNGIGSKRQTDYQRVRERAEYRLEHLDEMVEFEWKFARHKLENYRGAQIGVIRMVDELLAMKVSGTPKLALTRTQRKNRKRKEQRKRKERRERMADEHGPGPPKKPVHFIISLGSTKTGSMKYIKGHVRASLRRFVNEFERRDNVLPILVNEFRTSKTHHKCGTVMLDTRRCLDNRSQRKRRRQPTPFHPPMSIPTFKPWGDRWCYHGPCNLACVGRDQNAAINMLRIFEHAMARWLQNHTYDPNDRPAGLERP